MRYPNVNATADLFRGMPDIPQTIKTVWQGLDEDMKKRMYKEIDCLGAGIQREGRKNHYFGSSSCGPGASD
jgi:hypothetical protein